MDKFGELHCLLAVELQLLLAHQTATNLLKQPHCTSLSCVGNCVLYRLLVKLIAPTRSQQGTEGRVDLQPHCKYGYQPLVHLLSPVFLVELNLGDG